MTNQLFEPCTIGPVRLRNRSIRAAAFEGMCPGHLPSPELLAYHREVAEGGVGMTTVAYAAVEQSGLSFPHQLWLRPEAVPGLRALTDVVHVYPAAYLPEYARKAGAVRVEINPEERPPRCRSRRTDRTPRSPPERRRGWAR
nr:hypothetical protein [Nannocystis exedens]